ncbi:vacuolar-sorting protein, putative [Candida dubliniensis CD36]|uniref:BRO domain-containing protein 1 n=1 Tax=Candida dubliniensis (strain CD36 / ATCC MYA-646 / CBS 7987 / NCPF 3949 / NRRL Y-17841) TaxID=573826 RepID=B9WDE0_CANDC|nr:vacuolar-sorting protein, putative [Candida dubliniensis CD36]CAX42692.1 vacuolar-sorting protein, putative [Candida dubliniensis CD36]
MYPICPDTSLYTIVLFACNEHHTSQTMIVVQSVLKNGISLSLEAKGERGAWLEEPVTSTTTIFLRLEILVLKTSPHFSSDLYLGESRLLQVGFVFFYTLESQMKTHLLVVPSKKTEEVNWVKPLNNYLLSIYGNTSQYQDDINSLNKLRQDIRGVNADDTGLKLYYGYYSKLELIDLRIPFHDLNKSKKLQFEWFDSFSSLPYTQNSLAFEKVNVLYNIGAILSKFAQFKYNESQQLNGPEGETAFKQSISMLQQSSGIYQFINENFLHAPSQDLAQSTIKFLSKLMIAQSQEIFTLKVISGDLNQSKNSLIAKLCKSTSVLYEDCYNMINKNKKESFKITNESYDGGEYEEEDEDDDDEDDEGFLERPEDTDDSDNRYVAAELDSSWISIIYFKYEYYKSLAYYFNGLHLDANRKYGDAIAYLTKSQEVLNGVHSSTLKQVSKGSGDVYELLDNYKYQKDAVTIRLNDLNKDNDLIYHDIVPNLVTLPEIKPMDSTKIIKLADNAIFHEINEKNYNNFLVNVVPVNIHELSSYYSEEKSQYLRNEIDHFEVSNEEVSSVLEYLKLPKALVSIKESLKGTNSRGNNNGDIEELLSRSVIDKVNEISSQYSNDIQRKIAIENSRKEIYQLIKLLTENNCQDDAIQLKKILYDASVSDTKLFALIDETYHRTLGSGIQSHEFKSLFNNTVDNKSNQDSEISLLDIDDNNDTNQDKQIKNIEDYLNDLNNIKQNKFKLIEKLKKEIHNDDISDILVLNMKLKSTNEIKSIIFPEELKKFHPFTNELDKLINKEKSIIEQLKIIWDKLISNPQIKTLQMATNSKTQLIVNQSEKIDQFYGNWLKYHNGLIAGEKFYSQLLDRFKDFRNNIDNQLNKGMRSLNIGQQFPTQPMLNRTQSSGLQSNYTGQSNISISSQPSGGYNQQQQPQSQSQFSGGYNQQYTQPQGGYSQFQGQTQTGYQRQPPPPPPQLPPKQTMGSYNFAPTQQPPPQQQQQQAQPQPQPHSYPYPQQRTPQNESNLIYDNPSTYNPNMYNFFSSK